MKRFWDKVAVKDENECWEWLGHVGKQGYGRFNYKGKSTTAHRAAWEIAKGDIPTGDGPHGTCVLHVCDNRKCVNPEHLFLGSNADNIRDMHNKGRCPQTKLGKSAIADIVQNATTVSFTHFSEKYGVNSATVRRAYIRHGGKGALSRRAVISPSHTKLTEEAVIDIRKTHKTYTGSGRDLARKYGVAMTTILNAFYGRDKWTRIPCDAAGGAKVKPAKGVTK